MNNFLYFWNHFAFILLMMGGLFIIITSQNYLKKIVGLAIFQTAVFVFFVFEIPIKFLFVEHYGKVSIVSFIIVRCKRGRSA